MNYKKIAIILIILFISFICFSKVDFASAPTPTEKQKATSQKIATYAEKFYNSYANDCVYSFSSGSGQYTDNGKTYKENAFNGKKSSGKILGNWNVGASFTNKFPLECVGFVNLMIYKATRWTKSYYYVDYGSSSYYSDGYTLNSTADLIPGDILERSGEHLAIYIGNGRIIHMTQGNSATLANCLRNASISYRDVNNRIGI